VSAQTVSGGQRVFAEGGEALSSWLRLGLVSDSGGNPMTRKNRARSGPSTILAPFGSAGVQGLRMQSLDHSSTPVVVMTAAAVQTLAPMALAGDRLQAQDAT